MLADFPGTITFTDDNSTALPCALVIGIEERETVEGGFSRVRSATVYIAKETLATLPNLETRPAVTLVQEDGETETMRVYENHAQSESHWLLRCGQINQ
jgi:hypothetical protein